MKSPSEITKDELLTDDTILGLFSEDNALKRETLVNKYRDRAKQLGCLQQFNNFVKLAEKEKREADKASQYLAIQKGNTVTYSEWEYPALNGVEFNVTGWICNDSGVWRNGVDKGFMKRVAYQPVFPIEILTNIEDGKQRVKLVYKYRGVWKEIMIPRSTIASSSQIVQLSAVGITANSENAKGLVEFFADIENFNTDIITSGLSTSKLGWTESRDFIPFDNTSIQFDAYERFSTLYKAITEQGSKAKWYELAKKVRKSGRKEPALYLIASLASPLLKPLNLLPFFVNLWTDTGRGKTVALMLAASVWGNPAEGQYLSDPTSTKVAFEQRCQVLNNLPLMIDDLSKMNSGNNDEFVDMIYFLCGGKGKDRSDVNLGLTTSSTWKNIIVTNMERPLANETMRGGAINRILDIECEEGSFFMEGKRDKGKDVVELVKNNYGFAGRDFVEIIKNYSVEELKTMHSQFVDAIKYEAEAQNTTKEEKQIAPLALLLVADAIAEEHLFRDGINIDIPWAVSQLKSCDEVSENQRAYDDLCDLVSANRMTKFCRDVNTEQWGFVDENEVVYFYPVALKRLSREYNFAIKALCTWADKRDLLVRDKGRLQKSITDYHTKTTTKYYAFKLPRPEVECYAGETPFNG